MVLSQEKVMYWLGTIPEVFAPHKFACVTVVSIAAKAYYLASFLPNS